MDISNIFETIYTKEQLMYFVSELTSFGSSLYNAKNNTDGCLKQSFSVSDKELLLRLMKINAVSITNHLAVAAFIEQLKETLNSVPLMQLTLSFNPSENQVQTFSSWISTNCQKQVLLDIAYDPRIIGGAIIAFNGKYANYSLQKKLTDEKL